MTNFPEPIGLHVRAIWFSGTPECSSLPIAAGQALPAGLAKPDEWGVYTRDDENHLQCLDTFETRETAELDLAQMMAADESNCAHDWVCTGSAFGGDDDSYHGEGRTYCTKCGADGDA